MKSALLCNALLAVSMAAALATAHAADAAKAEVLQLEGDLSSIHDPAIARDGDNYYVFATNPYQQRDVKIIGPYVDKAGKPMMDGGAALLIEGNEYGKAQAADRYEIQQVKRLAAVA